jgi:predicted HicB family RNase H-like nuclease
MARQKAGKKMPATAQPEAKAVRLDLTPEVHRLLRMVAAHEGLSMAAYARTHLERHLREEAKRRGIKG